MNRLAYTLLVLSCATALFLVGTGCDSITEVSGGNLRVVAATTGGDLDRDGYRLVLDGVPAESVGISTTVVKRGLPAGEVSVELAGIAPNCRVAGANPRLVTVTTGATVEETFAVACVGTWVHIEVKTGGLDLDSDGYLVAVDTLPPVLMGINHTMHVKYLTPGDHSVVIDGLAGNCSTPDSSLAETLALGDVKPVTFNVTCVATTGVLLVETTVGGIDLPANIYGLIVDGGSPRPLHPSSVIAIAGLSLGDHAIRLDGVAPNCTVAGGSSRTVTLTGGTTVRDTARVRFDVQCGASFGVMMISATQAGLDLDDTLGVQVNGGPIHSLMPGGQTTLSLILAGDHSVRLVGVNGNCTVGGANPRIVTVTTGGAVRDTVRTTFDLACVARTGSLAITAASSGADLDPNGYQVQVDGGSPRALPANGTLTIDGLAPGGHSVAMSGLTSNCATTGNPRMVQISAGSVVRDTARTTFDVVCLAISGSVQVNVVTSGVDPDANGFSARIYGQALDSTVTVAPGGSATIAGVPGGSHLLSLGDVSLNCTVSGLNPAGVTVVVGATATVTFDVVCAQAGRLAVIKWNSTDWDLFTVQTNGGGLTPLAAAAGDDTDPAWAFDGTAIAFTSRRDGNAEIYRALPDGSGAIRLTNHPSADTYPAWSPDGSKIAFSSDRDGNTNIWVMNADGSNLVRLTSQPGADGDPAWSPDGSKIAFNSDRDGNFEIYVMNADGSGQSRLTFTPETDMHPDWSPDGSKLVFSRMTWCYYGCDQDLAVINADGSGRIDLPTGTLDQHPVWSPDGQSIAYEALVCDYYNYGCYSSGVMAMRLNAPAVQILIVADAYDPAWRR